MATDFFNLHDPIMLQWCWVLPVLAGLFAWDLRRRQRMLALFVSQTLLDDVSPRHSVGRPIARFIVLALALAALILAAARPRWDPQQIELEQHGQNLLFCVDVSNSMRAHDVDPSRLEGAKAAIRTLVTGLPAGNQVGLLVYAGSAELKCPLTPNYSHFLSVLDQVTYNSVDVGGTNLGDAIHKATVDVFGLHEAEGKPASQPAEHDTTIAAEQPDDQRNANALVVLTDGESHEGHAREMAQMANRLKVGLYIIGLGTAEGAPIPIELNGKMTTLKYKGQEVITKYDDASLRAVIADLPDRCGYLAAGASNVDLADIYRNVIARQGSQTKELRVTVWQEKFQLFVGIGLALLLISSLMNEQRPVRREGGSA